MCIEIENLLENGKYILHLKNVYCDKIDIPNIFFFFYGTPIWINPGFATGHCDTRQYAKSHHDDRVQDEQWSILLLSTRMFTGTRVIGKIFDDDDALNSKQVTATR